MNWLRKHKGDIVDGVKFFIMMHTMLWGFWWSYISAWNLFDLPTKWWSICIAMALALLSLFGFCQWCTK
jgi:hypothetical protein